MICLQGSEHFVGSDRSLYNRRFFRQRKDPRNGSHEVLGSIRLEVPRERGIALKIGWVNQEGANFDIFEEEVIVTHHEVKTVAQKLFSGAFVGVFLRHVLLTDTIVLIFVSKSVILLGRKCFVRFPFRILKKPTTS